MNITSEAVHITFEQHTPEPIGDHRIFAVLVPFVERGGELYLLYETRSRKMKTQPGETCFPGGHVEPGEEPVDCAVRETCEEIGIHPGQVHVAGPADYLIGKADFTLFPFVATVDPDAVEHMTLQRDEVDEVFLVKVSDLAKVKPEVYIERMKAVIPEDFPYERVGISENYRWRIGQNKVLVYEVNGRIIWGMTAMITNQVLAEMGLTDRVK